MNREILFRGKRTDNGEWVEGYYTELPVGSLGATIFSNDDEIVCENTASYIIKVFTKQHSNYSSSNPLEVIGCEQYEIIPDTVGQYTGLTDKNGNKIFEGDIFKFNDEVWESCYTSCGTEYDSWKVENYGVVGFDKDTGCYDFTEYKFNENSVEADLHENHDIEFAEFVSSLEVIGNIHDNPELLEVQHE